MNYKTITRRPLRSNQNPWPPPVYETARPARPGRVSYGQWDNYRTNFEDFLELYLLGIQVDMVLSMGTGHKEYLNTQ